MTAPLREPAQLTDQPLVTVTEFTDPACPWAWSSEPSFRLLRHTLGTLGRWRRVFGILFDEDDDPAPDPDAEARWYEEFIREVATHTGAPYAHRLRWLTRSSWPASQAAKAAEAQGHEIAERTLRRLRESTFLHGTPADSPDGIAAAVAGVPGLDVARLLGDAALPGTREAVRADWAKTRDPCPEVLDLDAPGPHPGRAKDLEHGRRYALPTLLFDGPGGRTCVPGWRPFAAYLDAASRAAGTALHTPEPVPPDEALARWRSLTRPELALLTGDMTPPTRAHRVDTGNGTFWLHPDEPLPRSEAMPDRKPQVRGVSADETPKGVH